MNIYKNTRHVKLPNEAKNPFIISHMKVRAIENAKFEARLGEHKQMARLKEDLAGAD